MGQKPICSTCKQPKTKVDEAMVSGFVGYICLNEECPVDR